MALVMSDMEIQKNQSPKLSSAIFCFLMVKELILLKNYIHHKNPHI